MFRILQAWRARRGKHAVRQNVAHDGERFYFETWAGSWVEEERAGLAIAGVLRHAGLKRAQMREILQQALEEVEREDDEDTSE